MIAGTPLLSAASEDAENIALMEPEDTFNMLDDTVGWAWGYAGRDRLVGYVRSDALA